MRTTIDIPDDLLETALEASRLRSKKDTVLAGLEELIRKSRREDLRRAAGSGELNVELMKSRKGKR